MQKLRGTALETLSCENLARQLEEVRGPNLLPETQGNDSAVTRNANIYGHETHTNLNFMKKRTRIFGQ